MTEDIPFRIDYTIPSRDDKVASIYQNSGVKPLALAMGM